MPPWHANPKYGHFANDGRMPEEEKQLIARWVKNGVPEGSAADLPSKREFVDGWTLGDPDLVLTMPEPITVSATGVVDYQYVTIDPGFKEGKWVRASEIRPGGAKCGAPYHRLYFPSWRRSDSGRTRRGIRNGGRLRSRVHRR